MTQNKKTFNVMVAGLSEDDQVSVELMLNLSRNRERTYQLSQYLPLSLVDIVLIDINNHKALEKWQQIIETKKCPHAVYICNKYSDIPNLNALVRSVHSKTLEKTDLLKILDLLDLLTDNLIDANSDHDKEYYPKSDMSVISMQTNMVAIS